MDNKDFLKVMVSSVFAVAIIIAAIILGNAYKEKFKENNVVSVTGLGEENFESDLIVWKGSFSRENFDLKEAYAKLEQDRIAVADYLKRKNVDLNNIVFSAVDIVRTTKDKYIDGKYAGFEFSGYQLRQMVTIESTDVNGIEKVSREVTELINNGITFESDAPQYFYTKLDDLKLVLISKATEDARLRAEKISENSMSELGKLKTAKMGVIQITARNSNDDYSWGGVYNTSSRYKTASITMKLDYYTE